MTVGYCWNRAKSVETDPLLRCSAKGRPHAEGEADIEKNYQQTSPKMKHKDSLKEFDACGTLRITTAAEEGNLNLSPIPNSFCTLKF